MIDHGCRLRFHAPLNPIIGSLLQVESSDNRDCDNRRLPDNGRMTKIPTHQPEAIQIFARMAELKLRQVDLAKALGIAENKVSKVKIGERQFTATEVTKANIWLDEMAERRAPADDGGEGTPEFSISYVAVDVLPTYGGMGGGGNGDGDRETALIPRALIEDTLRGRASDFLLVNVRGDSMEPDFRHGDQILIDKRDKSPAQPGPFALWDGEWGEYVIKNVERAMGGEVRVFSSNPKYRETIVESEQTRIIGRPVWFGRRL